MESMTMHEVVAGRGAPLMDPSQSFHRRQSHG
jgi:hypothetical protein